MMKGPVFVTAPEGRRDSPVHLPVLSTVKLPKTKAMEGALKRGAALGFSPDQLKKLLGA
jgi:hypothetical protein